METEKPYRVISKFGHDSLHGTFIFFQQNAKLFVFVQQSLVFDDDLRV